MTAPLPPLRLDYNNMFSSGDPLSHDLTPEYWQALQPDLIAAVDRFLQGGDSGEIEWFSVHENIVALDEVIAFAAQVRGQYDDVIIAGIGGSALGVKAVYQAVRDLNALLLSADERGGPRLFVVDNVDPAQVLSVSRIVNWQRTLLVVVTKSGGTLETMAGMLHFVEQLRVAFPTKWQEHIVTVTDPISGFLRRFSQELNLRSFPVPPKIGGRFSVLTAVGTLPLALAGVDVRRLLHGSATVAEQFRLQRSGHDAAKLAGLLYLMQTVCNRSQVVCMPYADHLRETAFWFRQLWAESLGKAQTRDGRPARCGSTPLFATGATDQHSQIQLYMEGPADKCVLFLEVEHSSDDTTLPKADGPLAPLAYLSGRSLGELLHIELNATRDALTDHGKPNATLVLRTLDEAAIGALFATLMITTAITGELLGVNTFDQPGVEAAKLKIQAALGS